MAATKYLMPPLALGKRQMASVAARKVSAAPTHQLETSLLPNGLKFASLDSDASAVSTVGILVKAGSSYENYDNLGVSHALRMATGLSSKNATSFGIVRNVQQMGGSISVLAGREYIMYTLTSPRPYVGELFNYLNEAVTAPAFKAWELNDHVYARMAEEMEGLDASTQAVELLHKAAYRNGLGQSLYSPEYMIGQHKTSSLLDFHAKTHTVTRTAVAANGVDHRILSKLASQLGLEKGHGPTQAVKYFGGEARLDCGGQHAVVALAVETGPATNLKDSLTCQLLRNVLGTGPKIGRGNLSGKLGKAVAKIEGQRAVSGINYSYQDSGLVGAFVMAEAAIAGNVVSEVVAALRGLTITDEDLKAAKKGLLIDMSETMLSPAGVVESIGTQTIYGLDPDSNAAADLLSTITVSEVQVCTIFFPHRPRPVGSLFSPSHIFFTGCC